MGPGQTPSDAPRETVRIVNQKSNFADPSRQMWSNGSVYQMHYFGEVGQACLDHSGERLYPYPVSEWFAAVHLKPVNVPQSILGGRPSCGTLCAKHTKRVGLLNMIEVALSIKS